MINFRSTLVVLGLTFVVGNLSAQLPATVISYVPIPKRFEKEVSQFPVILTGNTTPSYNNQPHWIQPHLFIFSSNQDQNPHTDVWIYDVNTKTTEKIYKTEGISEFSPTLYLDRIYTVRIEKDGKTQKLKSYRLDPKQTEKLTVIGENTHFPQLKQIGYFSKCCEDSWATFLVDESSQANHSLLIGNKTDFDTIATDIGPCIKGSLGGLYFTTKVENGFQLKFYFCQTKEIKDIYVLKQPHFTMDHNSNNILFVQDDTIFKLGPQSPFPQPYIRLLDPRLKNYSRIESGANGILLVSEFEK